MTFQIKDAAGNSVAVNPIPPVGPAAKSASLPTTLAADDPAVVSLAALVTAIAGTLKVLPLNAAPAAWLSTAAFDARNYAGVEIQVTAITGTATFQRSFDNVTYVPISAQDASYANVNPSATGFYSLKGGGYLKWTGTATILVRGYN